MCECYKGSGRKLPTQQDNVHHTWLARKVQIRDPKFSRCPVKLADSLRVKRWTSSLKYALGLHDRCSRPVGFEPPTHQHTPGTVAQPLQLVLCGMLLEQHDRLLSRKRAPMGETSFFASTTKAI